MPKSKSTSSTTRPERTGTSPTEPTPTAMLCAKADALFRAAAECCRQHERVARLLDKCSDDGEERAAYETLDHCDRVLREMVASYEKAGARARPNGEDEAWWHKANALWHASREFERRHRESDRAARKTSTTHDPVALAQLNMEYELEASAVLALRSALDGYRKVRPTAEC
jgi:hypothetical protein